MDLDWILLAIGYVLFLVLSRGVVGGAAKALTDWGRATGARRTASTSSS